MRNRSAHLTPPLTTALCANRSLLRMSLDLAVRDVSDRTGEAVVDALSGPNNYTLEYLHLPRLSPGMQDRVNEQLEENLQFRQSFVRLPRPGEEPIPAARWERFLWSPIIPRCSTSSSTSPATIFSTLRIYQPVCPAGTKSSGRALGGEPPVSVDLRTTPAPRCHSGGALGSVRRGRPR